MSQRDQQNQPPVHDDPKTTDEGGLRAPPGLSFWRKVWWWFDFVILVNLARLRFIAVLVAIGIVITQWDLLLAYYDRWMRPTGVEAAAGGGFEWFCPMHPTVVRDNPREKCPICFMPLSKRRKGEASEEPLPAGAVNRVQLSPYRVVLAGVQTRPVDYEALSKSIVAAGYVEFNERGQKNVSARVRGRIDKLFINETGQLVAAGDPLASLYSPELLVTVQNLRDAKQTKNAKNEQSARKRLELLGIDDYQIGEILTSENPDTHLTIRSPMSGHVIKKYVREGQYVEEGTPLYDLADLSTVWIQAQVYEDDIEFLPFDQRARASDAADGLAVTATTRSFPEEPFHGKLAFVYPHVDQDTRTVMVRFEVNNPAHKLRPGTTATVALEVPPKMLPIFANVKEGEAKRMLEQGRVLAVPESSVIETGSQSIVYREESPGVLLGVRVKLGPRMNNSDGVSFYPVLEGLVAGEGVVVGGAFLVDAETRLNPAAGSIYFGGSGGAKSGGGVTTVRPSTPNDEQAKIIAALAKLMPEDRKLAEAQRYCPVLQQNQLGTMGTPVKLTLEGQPVFLCCNGCKDDALADPQATLAKVARLKATQKQR
ncbi:MAG: efflux RND transporter periplasmic adaptor subunit [Planctomycetia bacterium]|nr:efflux RND transporter periplasmic adaptor subunit [Planctomycetia bacterium]